MGSGDAVDLSTLWDFADPAATERRFAEVLAREGEGAGADRRAEVLSQIARTQGLQRRFDEAHRTLDRAEALGATAPRARTLLLMERGRVRNTSGDPAGARTLFERAHDTARAAGLAALAIDAAHMLAIVSPPDEAIAWNERALAEARASSDPKASRWQGSLLNNLAWAHHDRGDHERALALHREALEWRRARGEEKAVRVARWSVARMLRALGRCEEALAEQRALSREYEAAGAEDGYVSEEIAECLLALGRDEEARAHFERAHRLLSADAHLVAAQASRLDRLARLATGEEGNRGAAR
jgi:tetratricopeptide (TPR) repeat protein